jgi:hypothetical protein
MPPVMVRCEYLPENILAWAAGSGCGAQLESPSMVMVGTLMTGEPFLQFIISRLGKVEPPAVIMDRKADVG